MLLFKHMMWAFLLCAVLANESLTDDLYWPTFVCICLILNQVANKCQKEILVIFNLSGVVLLHKKQ